MRSPVEVGVDWRTAEREDWRGAFGADHSGSQVLTDPVAGAADARGMLSGWGEGLPTETASLIRSCRRRALGAEILSAASFGIGFLVNFGLLLLLFGALT